MNDDVDASFDAQEAVADWEQLEPHRDEDQVQLDVNRSFIYYPNGMFLLSPSLLMTKCDPGSPLHSLAVVPLII